MIERYSIAATADQLADQFGIDTQGYQKPHYNAAPSQVLPVITMDSGGLSHFYWGASPRWASNKSMSEKIINVRVEHVQERAAIRKAMKKFRCVIPADGFYVWKKIGKKSAVPYRLEMVNRTVFGMAGLWEEYEDEDGEMIHTFTILTAPSNKSVDVVHDRMPVVLDAAATKVWLSGGSEEAALIDALEANTSVAFNNYTVSPRINNAGIDEASMILPAPASDQFGNLTLFN